MNKKNIFLGFAIGLIAIILVAAYLIINTNKIEALKVDLTNLTFEKDNKTEIIKVYTQEDYEEFITDYENNHLPDIYVTEFLFDGVSTYKPYDLDDFIESGNEYTVEALKIQTFNIHTTGNIELSGEVTGGMIAIDTNGVEEDINLLLNNVKIDTDSKKVPAIYIYNKDITYTGSKVTIKALDNTKNYMEGGKLKKISLIPSESLNDYTNYYSEDNKTNYTTYPNYYGVYTSSQIDNILFATTKADNEDLSDGDPYYYYKASGAISSDIDLYFEGTGYLEVTSKNKEGIETKGNLTFSGGVGDYVINAQDDCLNTTTDSKETTNARNSLTIDVNSLYAIVSNDADEGDAIDSNGDLIINGGTIVAFAKPGQDAGIDSETGIYINGGTVLATGDMYDQVNSSSSQNFMMLSFGSKVDQNDVITLLDEKDNVIFSYQTDRTYTNLVYSSKELEKGTYFVYKNGTIKGEESNGFYTKVTSYEKGTQLAYTSKGSQGGMMDGNKEIPTKDNNEERPELPEGVEEGNMTPPDGEMPNGDNSATPPTWNNGTAPPEKKTGETRNNIPNIPFENNMTATNKDFVIDGISNLFSGVTTYTES